VSDDDLPDEGEVVAFLIVDARAKDRRVAMSAQHMEALTARVDEDLVAFFIRDGRQAIEISYEAADPEVAAARFEALSRAAAEHAARIRATAPRKSFGGERPAEKEEKRGTDE
jgi:hypothetical protein